jgi:hypothetical protein
MAHSAQDDLKALHRLLMATHKDLLQFQKEVQQRLEGRELSPHEVYHLSTHHHEFEWIKKLFTILIKVDDKLDEKDATDFPEFKKQIQGELFDLIIDPNMNGEFQGRLEVASAKYLAIQKHVEALEKFIQG